MHGTITAPLIHRVLDPTFLTEVANDPEVRPFIGGKGDIDLSGVAANPANVLLQSAHGGFVLTCHEPAVYEVHSLFLPAGRKGHALECANAGLEWMFTRTDCALIFSKVPASNPAAKGLASAMGMRGLFAGNDPDLGACEYVELDLLRWAMGNAGLEEHGETFHDALEAAKSASGSALPVHPHDPAHERAVGAASLMIQRGQALKGVAVYNRWARLAGYAPLTLLSLSPLVLDVGDAVVGLGDDGMEILQCR